MTYLFWNADDADFGRWSRILILLLVTGDSLAPIVVEILFLDLTGFKNLLGLKKDCNGKRD